MHKKNENSVLTALADIQSLEDERALEEEKIAEARRLEQEQRQEEERRKKAEEAQKRRIEAERIARLDEERKRRDDEARKRIAALEAELAAVRAEREVMQFETAFSPPASKSRRDWVLALGLPLAATAAVYLAFLFLPPTSESPIPETAAPSKTDSNINSLSSEPVEAPPPSTVPPVLRETAPVDDSPKRGDDAPAKIGKKGPPRAHGGRRPPKPDKKEGGILENFEECGDDPLCEKLQGKKNIR